jgi:hypothetical protein
LTYAGYVLELAIVLCVLRRGKAGHLRWLAAYVSALFAADTARWYVLFRYGFSSSKYAIFYWLSDAFLALGAFVLVCVLFRQACKAHLGLWKSLRVFLVTVLVLVAGVSYLSLSKNYEHLFSMFIVEFQQDLYFTCLILNTLLYLLLVRLESADEQLNLLVCGLGLQFAGPAANLAFMYLTRSQGYSGWLFSYLSPLCTLGMLAIWLYAVVRVPSEAPQKVTAELSVEASALRPAGPNAFEVD